MPNLTPADIGIMAAALDDAMREGLGDDSAVEQIVSALIARGAAAHADEAYVAAYRFYREELPPIV